MKSYKRFLEGLLDQLVEAIRDCENREFHHMELTTAEWRDYNRLCGWATEVHERMSHYAKAKRTKFQYSPPAIEAPTSVLAGQLDFDIDRERGPEPSGPDGDPESV